MSSLNDPPTAGQIREIRALRLRNGTNGPPLPQTKDEAIKELTKARGPEYVIRNRSKTQREAIKAGEERRQQQIEEDLKQLREDFLRRNPHFAPPGHVFK